MPKDTLLISTRKGLFIAKQIEGQWRIADSSFLGDPVTLTFADPRDGTWYAGLDHGHFGTKLHRSEDRGATWIEVGTPVLFSEAQSSYPTMPSAKYPTMPSAKRLSGACLCFPMTACFLLRTRNRTNTSYWHAAAVAPVLADESRAYAICFA